jgi:hypothetical protein
VSTLGIANFFVAVDAVDVDRGCNGGGGGRVEIGCRWKVIRVVRDLRSVSFRRVRR